MSTMHDWIEQATGAQEEFHGFRVSVGEIAHAVAEMMERHGHLRNEMYTRDGCDALVTLLTGWDMVRRRNHALRSLNDDVTDHPAYLAAPQWLREMLGATQRMGTTLSVLPRTDCTVYLSSLVRGIEREYGRNTAEVQATRAVLADQIDRQFHDLVPERPRPTIDALENVPSDAETFILDLGMLHGLAHRPPIRLHGGQHASAADAAKVVAQMRRDVRTTLANRKTVGAAAPAVKTHLEEAIAKLEDVAIEEIAVQAARRDDGDGCCRLSLKVRLRVLDHACRPSHDVFTLNLRKYDHVAGWEATSNDMTRILGRNKRTGRTLTCDRVVAAALAEQPETVRRSLLDEALEHAGQCVSPSSLRGTPFNRLRVHHGTIGGTVELANGITWVDGAVRVRKTALALPDSVMSSIVGRGLRAVVDHDMLPDAVITKAYETTTSFRFVTDAKPITYDVE